MADKAFHVSPDYKVRKCNNPERCQFKGGHYSTIQDANEFIGRQLSEEFGEMHTLRSARVSPMKKISMTVGSVTQINDVRTHEFSRLPIDVSTADVLHEKPGPDFVRQVYSGDLRAF